MSHLLCLSFLYHRYRNDAIMRIYSDDHLLDELQLQEDIKPKAIDKSKTSVYRNLDGPLNFCWIAFYPEKFFLFEINELYLRKNIRIEVENNNNNYTNGFMSDYSYIKFNEIFLMPSSLLNYENWKSYLAKPIPSEYDYNEPFPIDIRKHHQDQQEFVVKHSTTPWKIDFFDNPRGGSFSVEIPVNKKNNIIRLGRYHPEKKIIYNYNALYLLSVFNQLNIDK